jgi:alkylation response protein AidB-like acyl-CoA dehydrogenase
MDFLPDDEQQQIIDSVRDFFASELAVERLRPERLAADDGGRSKWSAIGELGFFGLGLPESMGGVGYTLAEEALLFREAGRFLVTPALLAQVLGARIAAEAGQVDVAQALLSGSVRAAPMLPLGQARLRPEISGDFHLFDARGAVWLVAWREQAAVLLPAGSVRPQTVACLDEAIPLARASFHDFSPSQTAGTALARRASVLLAAQCVGLAEGARDMAVGYAKLREQFGQPIGGFQAIKHRCADMAVRAEAAWFQTVFAALSLRDGLPDAAQQVAAAVLVASSAAHENAAANVQVHGGMGYTAECNAHRYVKRARILDRLAGGMRAHERALLEGVA